MGRMLKGYARRSSIKIRNYHSIIATTIVRNSFANMKGYNLRRYAAKGYASGEKLGNHWHNWLSKVLYFPTLKKKSNV